MELRHNTAKVEIREEGESPVISGHGSVFFREDDPGTQFELWEGTVERVMQGAFDRAIQEDDVRGLFNHDRSMVLGRTSSGTMRLSVDEIGLKFEIDPPDTTIGRDVTESLRRGDVSGSSISFLAIDKWETVNGLQIRSILEFQLFDVGPVTFPAFESTDSGVRSLEIVRRSLEDWQGSSIRGRKARANYRRRQAHLASLGVDLRGVDE